MKHIRKWKAHSGKKFMRVRGHGEVTGQTRRALKTGRRYIAPQARSWNWIEVCRKEVPYSVFFLLSCWILVFGTLVTLFPDRLVQGRAEKLTLTPWKELDSILFVIQICTLSAGKSSTDFSSVLGWVCLLTSCPRDTAFSVTFVTYKDPGKCSFSLSPYFCFFCQWYSWESSVRFLSPSYLPPL